MNYTYIIFCAALLASLGCHGMKREASINNQQHLDFRHIHQESGEAQGKQKAELLLTNSTDSKELLRPLFNELDITLGHLKVHPECTKQFTGFIAGYVSILFRYNNQNPNAPIRLDPQIFESTVKTRSEKITDKVATKNHTALIKLITQTLTQAQLLVLPQAPNE